MVEEIEATDLIAAFRRFADELEESVAEHHSARMGVMLALRAAIFVNGFEPLQRRNLSTPFFHLLIALQQLEIGVASSLLKPAKGYNNRNPMTIARQHAHAQIVFCVDILRSAGIPLDAACKRRQVAWIRRGFYPPSYGKQ